MIHRTSLNELDANGSKLNTEFNFTVPDLRNQKKEVSITSLGLAESSL